MKSAIRSASLRRSTALAITAGLVSLNISDLAAAQTKKPIVIASNSVLCDLTKQIAQDTVDLKCLIDAGSDPHLYQPKPDDRKAIEQASLILHGGYNFEPEIIKLVKATSNPAPKIAVNEVAVPTPQQFVDDGETVNDPHVWHNARNGAQIAKVVGENLVKLQPGQSRRYLANTQKLTNELTQLDTWIKAQTATIPANQRKLVTTHDAFGYYSKAYAIPVVGALQGISTEERPTPKRIAELVKSIRQSGVTTIFAELTVNPKLIEAVAKEARVKVAEQELFADGVGEVGSVGDTYQKMLISNTKTIVEGLGGRYRPFALRSSQIQFAPVPGRRAQITTSVPDLSVSGSRLR